MDLFSNCSVERARLSPRGETLTYFLNTLHERKLLVAVVTNTSESDSECEPSEHWRQFVRASGYYRFLATNFRDQAQIEQKLSHYVRRGPLMPLIAACPKTGTFHFPDVMQFNIVWFTLSIPDIECAKIPACMQRHLFEHIKPSARLRYGNTSWDVTVDDCSFTDGFAEMFMENDIEFGVYVVLRHVGNFTFEAFMFDRQGFSLNQAGTPVGHSNPLHTPNDFLVYVESSFEDWPYSQLYCSASYLYVPKKTPKQWCEGFLRSCANVGNRLQIFYGKDDACFGTGPLPILRDIQLTFDINRRSTLFFLKHGRGRAYLLTISSCGVEELPRETNTYEIRTAARTYAADPA